MIIPAVELAIALHEGSHTDIDRSYGPFCTYVTQHAVGVEGPVHEFYLVGAFETDDSDQLAHRNRLAVFQTGSLTGQVS